MADLNGQITGVKPTVEDVARDLGLRNFLLGIYQKMALGLVLTGATAWATANSPFMLHLLYQTDGNSIGYTPLGYVFLSRRWCCRWPPACSCAASTPR
ncbi:MAG: hypothetical protein WDN06_06540 [Asticcacaulis sp.]